MITNKQFNNVVAVVNEYINKNLELVEKCKYEDGEYGVVDIVQANTKTINDIDMEQWLEIFEIFEVKNYKVRIKSVEIKENQYKPPKELRVVDAGLDASIKELEDEKWAMVGMKNPYGTGYPR